jgi:hypothetical protein
MARGVLHHKVGACRMSQYVDTFKIEVVLQRGDVIDQAVTPVARRVGRHRRLTGAPQVQHDQPPHRGQAAEVTEVDRIAHRPAGHADKRRARTLTVVRQPGSVKGMESRHNRHPGTASTAQPINWQWPAGQVGRGTLRATATLRCREASSHREQIWPRPRNQTATA